MANIQNVDYEALPGQAGQMRAHGRDLNKELTTAYSNVTNMHNVWYGRRYEALVREFNNIIPKINDLLTLVVGEIPFALETIANNYSQADKGANVVGAQNTAPNKIADIPIYNDVGMRFITSDVQNIQNQVTTNLNNAKAKMDTIESVYAQISWQSEASDAFRSTFNRLKREIVTSFENIKVQFARLMNQTQDDIQRAESSNTVG